MIEELHEEMANSKNEDILKDFGSSIVVSSPDKAPSEPRSAGIFDPPKKRRYWVDENGKNCFMVYARALTITWSYYRRYWRWYTEKEPNSDSEYSVEVAELLNVCWLEVQGGFETGFLTPDTEYDVSFVIKLKDPKYGWENKVDFSLTLPPNPSDPKICKIDLSNLPKDKWSNISVGKFKPSSNQSGRMDFTLRQLGKWKKGLVIKGVAILPAT